jgi:DNA repair protein RecN (Recombination protein N)
MLQELRVKNYALIRNLIFRPEQGLNVITGETGAGKSILLGALGLILGNRADQTALLAQDEKCIVEGLFHLEEETLKPWFMEQDLDWDSKLLLRREVVPGGKSRSFINDTPASLQQMKTLGESLVEIQTQHAIVNLQDANRQRILLDDFVGNAPLLQKYGRLFRDYREILDHIGQLRAAQSAWLRERDYLQFQFQELEQFQPKAGEEQTLDEEIATLTHSAEITKSAWEAADALDSSESGIINSLIRVRNTLKSGARYSPQMELLFERAEQVVNELRDISAALSTFNSAESVSQEHLESLNERQFRLQNLLKKHQKKDAAALLEYLKDLSVQLKQGDSLKDSIDELEQQCTDLKQEVLAMAEQITRHRIQGSSHFSGQVTDVLKQLEMQEAQLEVVIEPLSEPGPVGRDQVVFRFRSSSTLPFNALGKVASGGELARLMFAVQCVSAQKTGMPLLIFDEADSGVSGEVASKFGSLMRRMASEHQVIAITHLPQVAGAAHAHFYVYKERDGDKPGSAMKKLADSERVEELAVMISGKNPENSARLHAMTLLKNAAES